MRRTTSDRIVATTLAAQNANGGPVTLKEMGIMSNADYYIEHLVAEGLVKPVAKPRMTGQRGRPAQQFRLTDKARKRAQRILKSQSQVAA